MASAHSDLLPFELTGDAIPKKSCALMVTGIVSSVVWYYIEEIKGFNMASASPNTRATESLPPNYLTKCGGT